MKIFRNTQRTNLTGLFFIVLLLQHDVVVGYKLRGQTRPLRTQQASQTELQPVVYNLGPNNSHQVALIAVQASVESTSAVAGRRSLKHLLALQEWKRLASSGTKCPKPEACECHCDCPNTEIGPEMKAPPPCPVYPNMWPATQPPTTPAPTTPAPLTTTPAPLERRKCVDGEVKMSDGTCARITYQTILRLEKMVEAQKTILDKIQGEFNALAQPNCTSCPGALKYFEMRPVLQHTHQQYLAILKMFLGALALYKQGLLDAKKEDDAGLGDDGGDKGKGLEFVKGVKAMRPHCEPWTAFNSTHSLGIPGRNMCAIICRMQPSCAGFGWDPKADWCIWYDDVKPQGEDVCTSQTKTEYVKNWQGKINSNLWVAINKVHIFDGALQKALDVAKLQASQAGNFFSVWDEESKKGEDENKNLTDAHVENLTAATDFYGGTLFDMHNLKKQLNILRTTAYYMTLEESDKRPAFGPPKKKKAPPVVDKVKKLKLPEGLQEPLSLPPKPLTWHDFPNSEDTAWSQQHPECPMGAPCFCDCKCRGAPPQNFVEPPPPPYPPPPCPPPPLMPPPGLFSDIAIAASMR